MTLSRQDLDMLTDAEIDALLRRVFDRVRHRFPWQRVAATLEEFLFENDARKPGALDARIAAHPDYSHMIKQTMGEDCRETLAGTISFDAARKKRRREDGNPQGGAA